MGAIPVGVMPRVPCHRSRSMNRLVPHLPVQLLSLPGKDGLDFELPPQLEASEPPEASGLARDEVRLMVSYRSKNQVVHTQFRQLGDFLEAGDLLVINTSGTMNAAIRWQREDGTPVEVHLSTHLPDDLWTVEVRASLGKMTHPLFSMRAGEMVRLDGDGEVVLHAPYRPGNRGPVEGRQRLWIASLHLPQTLQDYLARYGFPIRYSYVREQWPLEYYQTVYATEMGSAEMPSAGRGFTTELITQLVAGGVLVVPLVLHTGVSSLEDHEPPYEEYYRVPSSTARAVNAVRASGGRVLAVGTTVVRALETVADERGTVHPGEGWTDLVISPQRGLRAVDGLLTGLHEPRSSHLAMLQALAGREHLEKTYAAALHEGYLWHEFGDLHLILP